jgi:hypothetical protein
VVAVQRQFINTTNFIELQIATLEPIRAISLVHATRLTMNLNAPSASLFDVYLRLRPSATLGEGRFLDVEPNELSQWPKHITIRPPSNDHRKRAVEKFAFTRVFEEDASQLDIFQGTGVMSLLEGVLGSESRGRDGLLATLGVTGSGKVTKSPEPFNDLICS